MSPRQEAFRSSQPALPNLPQSHRYLLLLPIPEYGQLRGVSDPMAFQHVEKVARRCHPPVVEGHDHVAELYAIGVVVSAWTVGRPCRPGCPAAPAPQPLLSGRVAGSADRGPTAPKSGALDLAVADDFGHYAVDLVHGDGEADPRVGPGRTVDCRVDADQAAGTVQQRAARVAGVDSRIESGSRP